MRLTIPIQRHNNIRRRRRIHNIRNTIRRHPLTRSTTRPRVNLSRHKRNSRHTTTLRHLQQGRIRTLRPQHPHSKTRLKQNGIVVIRPKRHQNRHLSINTIGTYSTRRSLSTGIRSVINRHIPRRRRPQPTTVNKVSTKSSGFRRNTTKLTRPHRIMFIITVRPTRNNNPHTKRRTVSTRSIVRPHQVTTNISRRRIVRSQIRFITFRPPSVVSRQPISTRLLSRSTVTRTLHNDRISIQHNSTSIRPNKVENRKVRTTPLQKSSHIVKH